MEQNNVTFGQKKLILGHNNLNYGTEKCDFLGQEKLILSHNKVNYGKKQDYSLGQEN
jgi:hypothetical protein